jgi:hypothetical protein
VANKRGLKILKWFPELICGDGEIRWSEKKAGCRIILFKKKECVDFL